MIRSGLQKLLVVLVLLTLGVLFLFRDSTTASMPVALQNILSGSGGQRRDFGPASPSAGGSVEKPKPGTKRIAKGKEIPPRDIIPVYEIDVPIPPFPSKSKVRVGMSRAELIGRFGEPNVRATWSDKGTEREKLLYQGQERSTEILIEDGSVVSTKDIPVR
jgi:hypothetical protein